MASVCSTQIWRLHLRILPPLPLQKKSVSGYNPESWRFLSLNSFAHEPQVTLFETRFSLFNELMYVFSSHADFYSCSQTAGVKQDPLLCHSSEIMLCSAFQTQWNLNITFFFLAYGSMLMAGRKVYLLNFQSFQKPMGYALIIIFTSKKQVCGHRRVLPSEFYGSVCQIPQ